MRTDDRGGTAIGMLTGAALAILAVVFVPSVRAALPDDSQPRTAPGSAEAPDLVELYRDVSSGVVRVEVTRCEQRTSTGSGALVAPDLILTAAHVAQGSQTLRLLTEAHQTSGTLVGYSPEHDLALVRAREPFASGHVFDLAPETPQVGTAVVALGYPLSGGLSMTAQGTVSGLDREVNYDRINISASGMMQLSLGTNQGNSGGPVLTLDRQLVGVVSGSERSRIESSEAGETIVDVDLIKFATPAEAVYDKVNEWQASPESLSFAACPGEGEGTATPPPSSDLVTALVDHPEVARVTRLFAEYAGGINDSEYERAYQQLSERRRSAQSLERFTSEQSSVVFYDLIITGIAEDAGELRVTTSFRTTQSEQDAPGDTGWTCALWNLDWLLTPEGPSGWAIERSRPTGDQETAYAPCSED